MNINENYGAHKFMILPTFFFRFTLHLVVFIPISVPNKLVANDDLVEGENGFYYITNEAAHVNYVC